MRTGTESTTRQVAQLFTVRTWQEELGKGDREWRGRVQHIPSGASSYFRDWETLVHFIQSTLSEAVPLPSID